MRLALVFTAATVGTSACGASTHSGASQSSSTVRSSARTCDPQGLVDRSGRVDTRGHIVADVDEDGEPEDIKLLADYAAPPRCRFVLAVTSAQTRRVTLIEQGVTPATSKTAREIRWPSLVSVIQIAPRKRGIVVLIDRGASTNFATVFFVDADQLVRPTPPLNRFPYGSSGLVAEAVDCAAPSEGTVVAAYAVHKQGEWSIAERFLRVNAGGDFVAAGKADSSTTSLTEKREFGFQSPQVLLPQPFPNCTVARVDGA